MTGDWELCEPPQDSDGAELLDTGHESQRPRWLSPVIRAAVALVAVAVVVSLVQAAHHPRHTAAATPPPSDGAVQAARQMSAHELALATIRDQAYDPQSATDVIRADATPGGCADLPAGDEPEPRLVAAVRRALPRFTVSDMSRTIDQLAALCAVEVRAHGPGGTILVLRVISPPAPTGAHPGIEHAADVIGTAVTSYVEASTPDGWTVVAGATGPSAGQPSDAQLLQLARDSALRW